MKDNQQLQFKDGVDCTLALTGEPFNDDYHYVDLLLTLSLLLIELMLVMKLPADDNESKLWQWVCSPASWWPT